MSKLMIRIRDYCVDKDNLSNSQKLQILKRMNLITEKFEIIRQKCKKIENKKRNKSNFGVEFNNTAEFLHKEIKSGIIGVVNGISDKWNEKDTKFQNECIHTVLDQVNFEKCCLNLCNYLKELKNVDQHKRVYQDNFTYDSMIKLKEMVGKHQKLISSMFD